MSEEATTVLTRHGARAVSRSVRLALFLDRLGAADLLLRLRAAAPSPWLTILTYHRVQTVPEDFPFDEGVVDAAPDEFDRQMAILRKYFTPVGIDELCDFADGRKLPRNPVLVTFDDGYRDNLEVALPILQRHGMRAAFAIVTGHTTERRVFWWDRINYLLKKTRERHVEVAYPLPLRLDLGDAARRREAIETALRVVKRHYQLDVERFLVELGRAAGVAWDDALERRLSDDLLLTWDGVRALRRAGMDVLSHSHTHRTLHTLSDPEIHEELTRSRAELEKQLGERVRAVAYPVGNRIDDRPYVRKAMAEAGYALGFTNGTGPNAIWGGLDRYGVRRLSMERAPDAMFRVRMAVPFFGEHERPAVVIGAC